MSFGETPDLTADVSFQFYNKKHKAGDWSSIEYPAL